MGISLDLYHGERNGWNRLGGHGELPSNPPMTAEGLTIARRRRRAIPELVNTTNCGGERMAGETPSKMQCSTCGTTFDANDTVEMQNHQGHPLVHIEQA
jgi:hypothetical protein